MTPEPELVSACFFGRCGEFFPRKRWMPSSSAGLPASGSVHVIVCILTTAGAAFITASANPRCCSAVAAAGFGVVKSLVPGLFASRLMSPRSSKIMKPKKAPITSQARKYRKVWFCFGMSFWYLFVFIGVVILNLAKMLTYAILCAVCNRCAPVFYLIRAFLARLNMCCGE